MHLPWTVPLFALIAVLSQGDAHSKRDVTEPVPSDNPPSEVWRFFHGFGRNKKVDCAVSETWSEWEGPNGFGGYERYRSIITLPKNGGRPCPTDLRQTKSGPKPTVQQVAKTVQRNFLRRGGRSIQREDLVKRSSPHYTARDLLVILDSSGSIGSDNFTSVKNDIAELLGLLCPADGSNDPFKSSDIGYHQAAFIQYSDNAVEEFDFDDRHPTSALKAAIRNINYIGDGTATNLAFNHAITMFDSDSKGLRNNAYVQKEILILTDGQSNCRNCSVQAAMDLKTQRFGPNDDEVKVYGLIIGDFSTTGQDEVMQYVSHPPGQHLFAMDGFDQLPALLQQIKRNLAHYPCVPVDIDMG